MVAKKRTRKNDPPTIIVEPHPDDYTGVPWVTLIQYVGKNHLLVVNTLESDYLWGYSIEGMRDAEVDVFYHLMEEYWYSKMYDGFTRTFISPDQWINERGFGSVFGQRIAAYNTSSIIRVVVPVREPEELSERRRIRRRKRVDVGKK